MGAGDRGLTADVLVAGGGPAGRAVARACARRGLAVTLVEPRPDRRWRHTYGVWCRELPLTGPDALPPTVVAASDVGWGIARTARPLDGEYAVLDTPALQAALHDERVRTVRGRVRGVPDEGRGAVLDDGRVLSAGLVVDATGAARALALPSRRPPGRAAEQTAVGVIVGKALADAVTGGRLVFMDWRPLHGLPGWPTFLYAIPLGGGRVLLEETSLARRPGLPLPELAERLRRRLLAAGVTDAPLDDPASVEHVRFAVDTPPYRAAAGVVPFGVAGRFVHPATGYSVARSLLTSTRLADALVTRPDHESMIDTADRVVGSSSARLVHAMRRRGLDVLLRMPPTEVPEFFERFFATPPDRQRAYLGAHDDVPDSLAAMLAVFGALSPRLRRHLVAGTLLGPGAGQRG